MSAAAWLGFLAAAAAGAVARALIGEWARQHGIGLDRFPWATLLINVTGSFALGVLTGMSLSGDLTATTMTILGAGFCGSYTTFSTFSYETVELLRQGDLRSATLNVSATLVVGIGVAAAGIALGGGF